jgi:hypothetical protein
MLVPIALPEAPAWEEEDSAAQEYNFIWNMYGHVHQRYNKIEYINTRML